MGIVFSCARFFSLGHGVTKSKSKNARNVTILGKSRNLVLFYSVSQYDYFRRNFFELKGTALFVSHFTSENDSFKNIFLWSGEGYLKLKCCYLFCDVVNCKESKESLNLFPFIFSAIL